MDFENPLHLDDACKGEEHTNIALETLNGNETAEDSTRDKDRDISTFEKKQNKLILQSVKNLPMKIRKAQQPMRN